MLLREFKDTLQNFKKFKVTNEYFANLYGTTPQNISKRMKNDSEITVSELEIAQKDSGMILYARVDDSSINISDNSGERQNDTTVDEKSSQFGKRLSELQAKHNFLDREMAQLLKISEKDYLKLVTCKTKPDLDVLNRIKQNFKVSVDYLLYGD